MIAPETLAGIDASVTAVLDGAADAVDVIDYGEISTVIAADGIAGRVVCKRLPAMTAPQLARYVAVFDDYLERLSASGITPAPSEVHAVGRETMTPYCVQPLYPRLLVDDLRTADTSVVERRTATLCALIAGVAGPDVGLDGQVSNWAIDGEDLVYLDVTTPLLRDATGRQRVDLDLFIASLPWALRAVVRRFLLGEILSHYHAPRPVLLDAIANLHKERLDHVVPAILAAANEVVDPPITADEAVRYYRRDAFMWEALQRLRRADRWWQRRVRRRRYPYLLPGTIER